MDGFEKEVFQAGILASSCTYTEILEAGCRTLDILRRGERFIGLVQCSSWSRGGSETYVSSGVLNFYAQDGRQSQRKVIAKAYCGFGLAPEDRVELWRKRAWRLAKGGVPVSNVYSTYKGILFAEHIEWSLIRFLKSQTDEKVAVWAAKQLINLANSLDHLKVHPISLLDDLRTNGLKIYLVDFGEDLGEVPGSCTISDYCRNRLHRELISHDLKEVAKFL